MFWVLSARDPDAEGWMNLLLPILVAVFWAIGGLVNAKKQRKREKAAAAEPSKAAATSPEPPVIPAKAVKPVETGPRPAVKGPTGRKGARPKPPKRRPPGVPQRTDARPAPAMEMPLEELPEVTAVSPRAYKKPADKPAETAGLHLEDLAASYSDPEVLRLAILHREILGKPVGLRDDEEGLS